MGRIKISMVLMVFLLAFLGCSSDSKTLKVSVKKLNFEQVPIGNTETKFITLTNKYGKELNISTISLSGSPDYTIIDGGTPPILLAKNETHDIEVQFEPSSAGILDGLISIKHDLSEKTKDILLVGEGVPVAKMDLSDIAFDFGIVYAGVTKSHDFIVTNIGSKELTVNSITLVGANTNLYNISAGDAPFTVATGLTHTFTLEFTPVTDGSFPITMELNHDAINKDNPFSISIDGSGVTFAPEIKFSETSTWNLGAFPNTGPSYHELVITSDGIDPLSINGATFATGTEFSVVEFLDKSSNIINLPQTFQPGETLTIRIKFEPTAIQKYNDTLTIQHDAINESRPYDFGFEAEGRAPIVKTFVFTGAIENWSVPAGVTNLTIEVWGAQGARTNGGLGAYMKGDFTVAPGDTLKVLVGEKGKDGDNSRTHLGGGGGGGSFVCKSNNDPMIIAGGGGADCTYNTPTTHHGRATTDGGDTYNNGGGINGNGGDDGQTNGPAAGGGGLLTDGQSANTCTGGSAFVNGGAGGKGTPTNYYGGDGGFGGGGGGYCSSNAYNRGGGGGGYSGGQGGTCSGQSGGGGGGSYNDGSNKTETGGVKTGDGEIKITY